MITEPTVFILGAGASKPYGFPTGKELRSNICRNLEDQYDDFLNKCYGGHRSAGRRQKMANAKDFLKFYKSARGQPIDLFLARNPQYENIGKIAIILNILHAEGGSKFDEDLDEKNIKQDWYNFLFEKMSEGLILPDSYKHFKDNAVSFITFNYDRSLEHFLFDTLIHSFTKLQDIQYHRNYEQNNKLIPFPFIHVYGEIAKLHWQHKSGLPYDSEPPYDFLENLTANIRVIHERADKELEDAKGIIRDAKKVFFLGFGYAPENLKILDIPNIFKNGQNIYGTALQSTPKQKKDTLTKLTPNRIKQIVDQEESWAKTIGSISIFIEDKNCRQLLEEYL